MSVTTVPLDQDIEASLEQMISIGLGSSKADLMRKAIKKFAEDQAVLGVLEAEQEEREGKLLKGDIFKLAKRIK